MPEQFLSKKVRKTQTMEFQVFAWRDTRLRVDILCYNAKFVNFKHLFMNSTSVEIRRPFRAIYGADMTFAMSLVVGYQIALPFNSPSSCST